MFGTGNWFKHKKEKIIVFNGLDYEKILRKVRLEIGGSNPHFFLHELYWESYEGDI